MVTSLSEQLNQLKVPQSSLLQKDKRKPSLLYDPKEAAELDRETVLQLGQKGLQGLIALCDIFKEFEVSLFALSSLDFERSVRSARENEKLDAVIEKFLILLSPHFLMSSAHKALEWLIYRFHIQQYNKDQFLLLILPYHESNIFVRALQLVDISSPNDNWHWLSPLQKVGVPLVLHSLTKQICSDNGLLKLICEHVINATRTYGSRAESLGTLYGLYMQSLIGWLNQSSSINEIHVNHILSAITAGLSSPISGFSSSTYMILSKLMTRINLTDQSMNSLLLKLVKKPSLRQEAMFLFLYLYENPYNRAEVVSEKLILRIAKTDWFIGMLVHIKSSGIQTSNFISLFFRNTLRFVIENSGSSEESKLEKVESTKKTLTEILQKVTLNAKEIDAILNFATIEDLNKVPKNVKNFLVELFARLERKYPEKFDNYLKKLIWCPEGQVISEDSKRALKFLMHWHSGASNTEVSLDIISKLHHYSAEQRIMALKMVAKKPIRINDSLRESIISALLARFEDSDSNVVHALLNIPVETLSSFIKADFLVEKLLILLADCHTKTRKFLASPALKILLQLHGKSDNTAVFLSALPYIFPSSSEDTNTALQVLSSEFAKRNPFLKKVQEEVEQQKLVDSESICSIAFHNILKRELLPPTEEIMSSIRNQMVFGDAASSFFHMMLLGSICRVPVGELSTTLALEAIEIVALMLKNNHHVFPLSGTYQLDGQRIKDVLLETESGFLPLQAVTNVLETVHRRISPNLNSKIDFENDPERSHLILKLLEVFFSGLEKPKWREHFKSCLTVFFRRHFPSSTDEILRFLSRFFIKPVSQQTTLHCLQMALTMIRQLEARAVKSSAGVKLNQLKLLIQRILQDKTFLPNLLVALSLENQMCRKTAVGILETLVQILKTPNFCLETGALSALLSELAERHVEIFIDSEQLALTLYMLLSPDPDVSHQFEPELRGQLQEARKWIFGIFGDEETPIHLKAQLLKILVHVNSPEIVELLTPLGRELTGKHERKFAGSALLDIVLKFTSGTVEALLDDGIWEFFVSCMMDTKTEMEQGTSQQLLCVLVMKQIDATFFSRLRSVSQAHQKNLFSKLVGIATECEIGAASTAATRVMRRIRVDARLVVNELKAVTTPVKGETKAQSKAGTFNPEIVNSLEWKRAVTLLEFIQDADNVDNEQLLVPVLLDLLRICLSFEIQSPVEYANQLILSTLHHLSLNKVTTLMEKAHLHIEIIAKCMRISHNPQTHHHALLLLVELFKVADMQSALQQVMPIFTFMGSSVLRQDDAYSIQIISKTIETIVPVVNKANNEKHACEILRIFVTTLPDIPEHRRTPLFVKLLQLMSNHLHLFYLLTFESQVSSPSQSQESTSKNQARHPISERLEFALQMSQQFSPCKLLKTCAQLLEFFKALLIATTESTDKERRRQNFLYNYVFDLVKYNPKDTRHMKYVIVQFLVALLSSSEFVNRIAELNSTELEETRLLYEDLIIRLVLLIQSTSKREELLSPQHPRNRYWKAMLAYLYDVLDRVNNLLPNRIFLDTVKGLLLNQEVLVVRRKVLELLNVRLQQKMFLEEDQKDLLDLMEPLLTVFEAKYLGQEMEIIQQTTLMSLKLLAKLLALTHQDAFIPILELTTDILKTRDGLVLASASLCIAELCSSLGPYAVQSLNKFFPAMLLLLDTHCNEEIPDITAISIVSALFKIIESVGNFISTDDLDQLLIKLCRLSSIYTDTDNAKIEIVSSRLKAISQKLSSIKALRVLLPAIDRVYETFLKSKSVRCVGPLMNILAESFTDVSASDLNLKEHDLTTFFLRVLDFRKDVGQATSEGVKLEEVVAVEESTSKALVTLVLKMSETTFRPFFYKLYDWAARNPDNHYRNITFYRLSANIAECLKSLFVLFAGHFLKHAATLLTTCNAITGNEEVPDLSDSYKIELSEAILLTLTRTFSYDAHDFVNQERFEILMTPLVDQLENILGSREEYERRARELIVPCIAAFAAAISDDTLHKQLVYHVLLKTKHDKVYVRTAALNALVEIVRKLGEDFMPLLPETIPVLSELQEDEDMEQCVQNAIWTLQELLGEPLEKYL